MFSFQFCVHWLIYFWLVLLIFFVGGDFVAEEFVLSIFFGTWIFIAYSIPNLQLAPSQWCKSLGCNANFSHSGESLVLGCPPFPLVVTIVVTSKVSMFLVGDFYKPSFATIIAKVYTQFFQEQRKDFFWKKWPHSALSCWFPFYLEEVVHLCDMLKKGRLDMMRFTKKQHSKTWAGCVTWKMIHFTIYFV